MPTGYTSELYDGKPQTFSEFALQCARAMGATIMQRDDPSDVPLRLPKPSTSYSDERLSEAQADLDKFRAMPAEVADDEAEAEYQQTLAAWHESQATAMERERAYRSMLAEVAGWRPPTKEHEGMKKFMTEQLEGSIDFDCSRSWGPPTRLSGDEYREYHIAKAEKDLTYHTKAMAEEIERTNGRRAWITALADSLGIEVVDDVVVPT